MCFISAGTAQYFVYVYIRHLLDFTQGSHYYWHRVINSCLILSLWSVVIYKVKSFFVLLINTRSGLLAWIELSVDTAKYSKILAVYHFTHSEFFTIALAEGFHWSLSDSKCPHVFQTNQVPLVSQRPCSTVFLLWQGSNIIINKPLQVFFTPALVDRLLLLSKGHQISLGLQGSSQYSGPSYLCSSLDGRISSSSCPLSKLSRTVPSTPITTDITPIPMFHNFLSFQVRSGYLSLFCFLLFCLWSAGTLKSTWRQVFFFFKIISRSCILAGIR